MRKGPALAIAAALGLSACLSFKPVEYREPLARGVQPPSPDEAAREAQRLFGSGLVYGEGGLVSALQPVAAAPDALVFHYPKAGPSGVTCRPAELAPTIQDYGASTVPSSRFLVRLGGGCPMAVGFPTVDSATSLLDALTTLKHVAKGESLAVADTPADAAAFEKAVAFYRAQATRPALPEDARRFKVQAEAAVREKRDGDAVDLYAKALRIAPWWPDGHYNRALLLADEGLKADAILEMKKYLRLEPNASDARAAQDKIYEWGG